MQTHSEAYITWLCSQFTWNKDDFHQLSGNQGSEDDLTSTFEQVTRVRVESLTGWESGQSSCMPCPHPLYVSHPPVSQQSSWQGPPCASSTDQAAERHIDTPLRSFTLWRKLNLLFLTPSQGSSQAMNRWGRNRLQSISEPTWQPSPNLNILAAAQLRSSNASTGISPLTGHAKSPTSIPPPHLLQPLLLSCSDSPYSPIPACAWYAVTETKRDRHWFYAHLYLKVLMAYVGTCQWTVWHLGKCDNNSF